MATTPADGRAPLGHDRCAPRGRRRERPLLLVVTPDFPPARGGIQVVVDRLARGIDAFETVVVAPDGPGAGELDARGGPDVRRFRGGGALRGAQSALLNAAALRAALALRPDVTLSAHIVASPAAAAIRRATGARTAQYFYAEEIAAKPRLAAFAAREADLSIAISEYTAGLVRATGATPRSLSVVPVGADVPAELAPRATGRPTVVTVARIEERYKGHDTMVRAFALVLAQVPDAQWIVIGDGSLRPAIEALARSYGIDRSVRFLGAVGDEERNQWLRNADLLAMPSRLPAGGFAGEGFGIVYLEAGAYGKPVVAGNVGGALDAVRHGETGLLVDPLDPLAVAEAIVALLRDGELARRLGRGGRERAERHAWPLVAARVQRLLLELLGPAGARAAGTGREAEGATS
jgi:phosphatidyl-myo-inositol dimannoside synthase